jgi:ATP-binding cassette subfamily C protein
MSQLVTDFWAEPELWEEFLLKLRYRKAQHLKTPVYRPHLLNAPAQVWIVYKGSCEVFSVPIQAGQVAGTRQHLFHCPLGSLLFGADLAGQSHGLLVMQSPETELLRLHRDELLGLIQENADFAPIVQSLIEHWLRLMTARLSPDIPPPGHVNLGDRLSFEAGAILRTLHDLVWVEHRAGASAWMDLLTLEAGQAPFPLSKRAWLKGLQAGEVVCYRTENLLETPPNLFAALDHFQSQIISYLGDYARQEEAKNEQGLAARQKADERQFQQALASLAQTLDPQARLSSELRGGEALLAACRLAGEAGGIQIIPPPSAAGELSIRTIAEASRVRFRQVALQGRWWQADNGPLVGSLEGRPVALIPQGPAAYVLHDPTSGQVRPVDEALAAGLENFATLFYRRLPDAALNSWQLLRFALSGTGQDLRRVLVLGLLIGLVQLSIPLATTLLFDQVIPSGEINLLMQVGGGLIALALANFLLQLSQRIAVLRLESRAEASIQAALWDRLLELSPTFYRQFTAGDLAARMLGMSDIRAILSGAASMSILLAVFSSFNLGLMLYYSPRLTLAALLLIGLAVALSVYLGRRSVQLQVALSATAGKNQGAMLQLVTGISKFKVAGAEARAFATWAHRFAEQRQLSYQLRQVENLLAVFNATYPLLALWLIFLLVGGTGLSDFSLGQFLGFNAAFSQFITAGLYFSQSLIVILGTVPLYQRLQPVLKAKPEVRPGQAEYLPLSGEIELSQVSFRYHSQQPYVLEDISFKVEVGEFVALVGASGSGKSSLLRLLLGFESPESGAIYYNGKDLQELDIRALRRQIGVVLQNARLASGGSLFSNIVGNSGLDLEAAWEAARMVGLDADIKEMPMGMHTVLTEGGGTLSGGQRQRLLIAAALVHRPRLIFFDEATSALDNRTQQIVSQSLEAMNTTRLVIAHRLSTIINADRIIVLEKGRIAQMGTYAGLSKQRGLFAEMVRRQSL